MKKISLQTAHRVLLAVGALFFLLGSFQENIWFDESYTVGLVSHSIPDLVRIALTDVHPPLYYVMLWPVAALTGAWLPALRIFSALGAFLILLTGYTHIRRDFGEKTGFWFSLLALLTPSLFEYSYQIRMYTWAALFVLWGAIYARRFFFTPSWKNGILFVLSLVAGAYCHHYGLAAACMVNVVLFCFLLVRKRAAVLPWLGCGVAQIGLFVPGILFFARQVSMVSQGYWISFTYPKILLDTLAFPWFPNIEGIFDDMLFPVWVVGLLLFILPLTMGVWLACSKAKACRTGLLALGIYSAIVAVCLIISLWQPIFHMRYTMVLFGFWLFFLAGVLSRIPWKAVQGAFLVCLTALTIGNTVSTVQVLYDSKANVPFDYIRERVQEGDILLYDFVMRGATLVTHCPDIPQIYYNRDRWAADAYEAFAPTMDVVDSLEFLRDFQGTIWIVSDGSHRPLDEIQAMMPVEVVSVSEKMKVRYKNNEYVFIQVKIENNLET